MSWISESWLTRDSFRGVYNYPSNQLDGMDDVIEHVVKDMLRMLLGDELYNLFIAEGYTEDSDNIYYKLREGEVINKSDNRVFNYEGLAEMLKLFVISYLRGKIYEDSQNGIMQDTISNGEKASDKNAINFSYKAFNSGVDKYYEAFIYLNEKREDFPTWKFFRLRQKRLIHY
jgi:hypothetical protein